MAVTQPPRNKIPRDRENDYTLVAATTRRAFLREQTSVTLQHVCQYSFDPSILPGNVEHFAGVAQVPIGIAGPLLVDVAPSVAPPTVSPWATRRNPP